MSLCTTVVHNTAQNSSDNLPSYLSKFKQPSFLRGCRSEGGVVSPLVYVVYVRDLNTSHNVLSVLTKSYMYIVSLYASHFKISILIWHDS